MVGDSSSSGSAARPEAVLLTFERYLRTHPGTVGVGIIGFFLFVAVVHLRAGIQLPLAITFAGPLVFCTYGVGVVAGTTAAVAIATIWLADALSLGMTLGQALPLFGTRLFSNLAIVGISAVAAAAARTRMRYLEAQGELVRLRADLVSAFSHDLRAPLTAMMGYAELLRDGADLEGAIPRSEALDRILVNGGRLNQLIADMLTAGDGDRAAPVEITAFSAEEFVAALRAEFDDTQRAGAVSLQWTVTPNTPALTTDRTKLTSVVRNLVGNALKFTTEGQVAVRIDYDAAPAAHRIAVADTGPGIASDVVPHIFDRFYRANETKQRAGFGVGLFIVKRLTELLGGTVVVRSQPGHGTTFVVTLPPPRATVSVALGER